MTDQQIKNIMEEIFNIIGLCRNGAPKKNVDQPYTTIKHLLEEIQADHHNEVTGLKTVITSNHNIAAKEINDIKTEFNGCMKEQNDIIHDLVEENKYLKLKNEALTVQLKGIQDIINIFPS